MPLLHPQATHVQTLFLDLGSHAGALACVTEHEVINCAAIDHRIDDRELQEMLEKTLRSVDWAYEDLTHLACVVGPGGFTSLRVAVAMTNALSWALKIPSCGIHLSDLYAVRTEEKDALWLHSTKKQELFVRGFGKQAAQYPEAVCVRLEELLPELSPKVCWMGELIPEHREAVAKTGTTELTVQSHISVLPRFLAAQHYENQTLKPWYGRGW